MINMLKSLFGFKNSMENPATPLSGPADWLVEMAGGGDSTSGVKVNHSSALAYPPLWRAVNLISGDVAKVPFELFKRQKENSREQAKKHPAYKLVRRKSNPWVTAYNFKRLMTYHALWYGNGFALIVRNGGGQVESLVPLDPATMMIVNDENGVWYVPQGMKNSEGNQVKYRAEDVFHLKGLSSDGVCGYDVISVMKHQLGLGMAAQEFGAKFFSNGANVSGVLMVPGKMDDVYLQNVLAAWNKTATGIAKSHKVGVLSDGVQFEPLTSSMEASQFTETRQFEVRQVANIMGVPPHKLGDDTRTAFASLEQENQSYLQECLDQWLCAWEDEAYDKLLSETEKRMDSHFFEFNRKALIRTDIATENGVMIEQLNNGILSLNDVLALQNRPPVDGGNVRRIPLNMGLLDADGNLIKIGETETPEEPETDPPVEPESTNEDEMEEALTNLLRDQVGHVVRFEAQKVIKAAGREENFLYWLGKFYELHHEKVSNAIEPALGVLNVHQHEGIDPCEMATFHCHTSESDLVELSGTCTTNEELTTAVTGYFDADRTDKTINQFMKGRENAESVEV